MFSGSQGSSDIVLCTNTAEVVCQGCHLVHAQHMCMYVNRCSISTPTMEVPSKNSFQSQGHLQLEPKNVLGSMCMVEFVYGGGAYIHVHYKLYGTWLLFTIIMLP